MLGRRPGDGPGRLSGENSRSWAQPQIRVVVAHGLHGQSVASFRPNDPLTQGELADLVAALTEQPPKAPADPAAPVTIAQLDARLVRALELSDEAALFHDAASGAGLRPPARFGTEVVARLLGLRTNHPAGQDTLERLPNDPAPRAEAAYSVARLLSVSELGEGPGRGRSRDLRASRCSPRGSNACSRPRSGSSATRTSGAASSSAPQSPFGAAGHRAASTAPGFAWRVYKLQSYPGAPQLASILRGRTAAAMAGEVPRRQRIKPARLAPADLMFFGPGGPRAQAGGDRPRRRSTSATAG